MSSGCIGWSRVTEAEHDYFGALEASVLFGHSYFGVGLDWEEWKHCTAKKL